ncbi:MAG: DinB family protein [Bacteroidetes bacterium]|nr:DinB family protein [Bacteroidota bacterium]
MATTTQKLLQQLENESITTRKMLSIIPEDKFDWQPHPKSMSLRRLATHIAELPGWVTMTMDTDHLDLAKNEKVPLANNKVELMSFYEGELAKGKASLQKASDKDLTHDWTLMFNGNVLNVRSKEDVIRMSLNQTIHHRAQLGVFLRLLDVPIPGSYGPSADESFM